MELDFGTTQAANEGALMTLTHPVSKVELTEDGKPSALMVHGKDSDRYRKAQRQIARRNTETAKRTKDWIRSPEQLEQDNLTLYCAVVSGWVNCSYHGVSEFSEELLRTFFDEQPWALEQVQEYVEGRANFSKPSPTS